MCDRIRASYDTVAAEYARRISDELRRKPFDCTLLEDFAHRLQTSDLVCDLGCGPGHVAKFLQQQGARAFGMDLSAGMISEARRLNPAIDFVQGSALTLPIAFGALGGIIAFYSLIHFDGETLAAALAEMHRALRKEGYALIAFHTGGESLHTTDLWGYTVDLTVEMPPVAGVVDRLIEAGFIMERVLERDPYPEVEYQSRRGYILARKH